MRTEKGNFAKQSHYTGFTFYWSVYSLIQKLQDDNLLLFLLIILSRGHLQLIFMEFERLHKKWHWKFEKCSLKNNIFY